MPTFFLASPYSNYFKPHHNLCKALGARKDKLKSPINWEEVEWNVCFVLSTCLSCARIPLASLRAVILPSVLFTGGSDRVFIPKHAYSLFSASFHLLFFLLWCLSYLCATDRESTLWKHLHTPKSLRQIHFNELM